jgi:hypothetical protein
VDYFDNPTFNVMAIFQGFAAAQLGQLQSAGSYGLVDFFQRLPGKQPDHLRPVPARRFSFGFDSGNDGRGRWYIDPAGPARNKDQSDEICASLGSH